MPRAASRLTGLWSPACGTPRRRLSRLAARAGQQEPHRVLGIPSGSSRAEIRRAYLQRIKQFHPDVSADEDSTEIAVQLNAAYKQLLEAAAGDGSDPWQFCDEFDLPEAEPDRLFVNPFACGINPLDWRKLQEVAAQGSDPAASLSAAGVAAPESALAWLSPAQLASVEAELTDMEACLSFEVTACSVADKLSRARTANNRLPVTWR